MDKLIQEEELEMDKKIHWYQVLFGLVDDRDEEDVETGEHSETLQTYA